MKKTSILWFRNDLRVSDNPGISIAAESDYCIPVYIFDSELFKPIVGLGFSRMDHHRFRFICESLADLKKSLGTLGSGLRIYYGNPVLILDSLVKRFNADCIICQKEDGVYEDNLVQQLGKIQQCLLYTYDSNLLLHPEHPAANIGKLPPVFTDFRKKAEVSFYENSLPPTPHLFPPLPEGHDDSIDLPEFTGIARLKGGESEAWKRLRYYFFETRLIASYKQTRNGLIGDDYSSKFSPWLASGCISAVGIYRELKEFEREYGADENTYWLFFELMWRDYFRLVSRKYGKRIFLKNGIKNSGRPSSYTNLKVFQNWCMGETESDFCNANMRELYRTGFMSNRGRQNVASYLVHDLGVDWRWGASWFEYKLMDYDVCSNWGNWMYIAGVGNDPRPFRKFNLERQKEMYDSKGDYTNSYAGSLPVPEPFSKPIPENWTEYKED